MHLKYSSAWGYKHTERQAERQVARQATRSHWNVLWHSKMGSRPIPKQQVERQNSNGTLPLDARCVYNLRKVSLLT